MTALLRARPPLLRARPALARLAALAVTAAGAALLLLAVARGTVWAPHAVTVVHVSGRPGAPLVDTTPEALRLDGPSVRVDVRAADPKQTVFVGVGRATDVDAYLGTAARTEITGVRGGVPVVGKIGTDTSLPEPAGVDVWALAVTGQGRAGLDWPQATGRWRVVAAADGATPPAEVVLTWQRDRATSLVPALSAVGGLLLVLGLVGLRATWSRTSSASRRPAATGTARTLDPAHAAETTGPRRRDQHAGPAGEASASAGVPSGDGRPADADLDDVDDPEEAPAPAPFRQEQRP